LRNCRERLRRPEDDPPVTPSTVRSTEFADGILPGMAFDPYAPYGPVADSTVRVVTWNVWGRYGKEWRQRLRGIGEELASADADIVCLVEAWRDDRTSMPGLLAGQLGLPHHLFVGDWRQEDWVSGIGIVSRWPTSDPVRRPLRGPDNSGFGEALHVVVDGDRGPIQLFVAALDFPLDGSATRQAQVKELVAFVDEVTSRRHVTIVCGDFNAGPDSDEIRMLTGRSAVPVPGVVFYDAWEMAGGGSPGYTWSNLNPIASAGLYPDRRFDYIFSAWPRRHGIGHPTHCSLLGVRPPHEQQLSDHFGVLASLRY
jgi:endonuclease/exonuclease/phosphatase family metal-dependent hydrolase